MKKKLDKYIKSNKNNFEFKEVIFEPLSLLTLEIGENLSKLLPQIYEGLYYIRQEIADKLGFIPPFIPVNLYSCHGEYQIKLEDLVIAINNIIPDMLFINGPENSLISFKGKPGTDHMGNKGIWIKPSYKDRVIQEGCKVYTPGDIIIEHMKLITFKNAHRLLGMEEIRILLDTLRNTHSILIDELIPKVFSLLELKIILKRLLQEKVSLRPLINILETLGEYSHITKDTDLLIEYIRCSLGSYICKDYKDEYNTITVITADARMERIFLKGVVKTEEGTILELDPEIRRMLKESLEENIKKFKELNLKPILLTSPETRLYLKRFSEHTLPDLVVLSMDEIPPDIKTISYGIVSVEDPEAYIESGDQYYRENKLDLAEAEYRRAVELDPSNARAHYALRLTYRKMGKLDMALKEYSKAIELDPKYEFIDLTIDGKDDLEEIYPDKSSPVTNELKDPKEIELELVLPYEKRKNSNIKLEENVYIDHERIERMKFLNPSFATIFNKMGEDYLRVGNYDSAKKEFHKAIELDIDYAEAHKNLGIVYLYEKDWYMCRKELEKALELNPEYLEAYIYLGKLFKMRNMKDKAEHAFYRAWELANKEVDIKSREEIKKELQELKNST